MSTGSLPSPKTAHLSYGSSLAKGIMVATFMLLPAAAFAQTPALTSDARATFQTLQGSSIPRADVFAGVGIWNEEGHSLTGLHLAGALRTGRHFAVVGDLVFYEQSTRTIMGGVRVYGNAPRLSVFGQFLVGSAPLDDIAFQPGFGVDIHLGRRAAVRAAFDVKISGDDGSTYIGSRFSTGLVIKLGRQ